MAGKKISEAATENYRKRTEKRRSPPIQKRKYRVRNEQIQELKTSLALGMDLEAYRKQLLICVINSFVY